MHAFIVQAGRSKLRIQHATRATPAIRLFLRVNSCGATHARLPQCPPAKQALPRELAVFSVAAAWEPPRRMKPDASPPPVHGDVFDRVQGSAK